MRLLDEELRQPNFKSVLGLREHLRLAGHAVNAKRVRRLVRLWATSWSTPSRA